MRTFFTVPGGLLWLCSTLWVSNVKQNNPPTNNNLHLFQIPTMKDITKRDHSKRTGQNFSADGFWGLVEVEVGTYQAHIEYGPQRLLKKRAKAKKRQLRDSNHDSACK